MSRAVHPRVAIVDYGMGNLFSVRHACEQAGLDAAITTVKSEVLAADAVILPGVGAFGDAMETLRRLDLIDAIHHVVASSKPLVGICLGMQMLMSESYEFGRHEGLGIIPGTVMRFDHPRGPRGELKVPHVCWNRLNRADRNPTRWEDTLLKGLPDGSYMYFVHSYHVVPEDDGVVVATTGYGHIEFCSVLQHKNIFACQCHPERSGEVGLQVYENLAKRLN